MTQTMDDTDELHANHARDLITAMLPSSIWQEVTDHAFDATATDTVWDHIDGTIRDVTVAPASRADVRVTAHLPEQYDLGNNKTLDHYAPEPESRDGPEPTMNRFRPVDDGVFLDLELTYRGRRTYALSLYMGDIEFDD